MNAFLDAVGRTPLSQLLQNVRWIIPLIQALHIFTLALVFTSAAIVDLRLLGVIGRDQALARMTRRFFPPIVWGVAILLVSGLLLMVAEPRRALLNAFFQLKMACLVVVCGLTLVIARIARTNQAPGDKAPAIGKPIAIGSLALWLAIIGFGRWIAYGP